MTTTEIVTWPNFRSLLQFCNVFKCALLLSYHLWFFCHFCLFFLFLQIFIGFHVWVQSRHKRFVYRKRYSSAPDPDIFLFLRNIVSFYVFGQDFCFSAICIFNLNLMHSSPRIGKSSHKGRNKFLLQKFLVCRRRPLFCTGYKKWSFVRVLWEWSFSDSPEIFQIPSARFADRTFCKLHLKRISSYFKSVSFTPTWFLGFKGGS